MIFSLLLIGYEFTKIKFSLAADLPAGWQGCKGAEIKAV